MRILKFDTINPAAYLTQKQKEWGKDVLKKLNRKEYLQKVLDLCANFSDFYTYNLEKLGWETEEFLLQDSLYIDKIAEEFGKYPIYFDKTFEKFKNNLNPIHKRWEKKYIRAYIKKYNPDVIFVREASGLESSFWKEFSRNRLLVSRIAIKLPYHWNMYDWNLIYTSTTSYKDFFELHNIKTYINPNGFDERILNKINNQSKNYEVSFIGGVGDDYFAERTTFLNAIAENQVLHWWGYGKEKLIQEKHLKNAWKGITAGLEMFQIYKDSKIIINDYISIAKGEAVNQRIFEVMGVGSFLLTKNAENLQKIFPKDIIITFENTKDCLDKVQYFLKHEKEREEIAKEAQKYVLTHYSYEHLMKEMSEQLIQNYNKKYGLS